MNARKCRWCNTKPCPYPSDKSLEEQRKWLRAQVEAGMPCWTPFAKNIGTLHDENGQMLDQ